MRRWNFFLRPILCSPGSSVSKKFTPNFLAFRKGWGNPSATCVKKRDFQFVRLLFFFFLFFFVVLLEYFRLKTSKESQFTCGWWAAPTLAKCKKVGSERFWNTTPRWTWNEPWKEILLTQIFQFMILRFVPYEPEPELTNLRVKINMK